MQKRSTVLRGKIISIPALSILSWCPQSSKALWDYSSTQAMTEAGQGQRGEETRCSAIPDLLQPWGKKRFCTEIREKPRDKAWGNGANAVTTNFSWPAAPANTAVLVSTPLVTGQHAGVLILLVFYFLLPQEQQHFFPQSIFSGGKKIAVAIFVQDFHFLKVSPHLHYKAKMKGVNFFSYWIKVNAA